MIFDSGIDLFGEAQAEAYQAGLEAAFDFLADFPHAVRLRTEVVPPVRAFRYKAHLILYDIQETGILIVRVRHVREDWQPSSSPDADD